MREKLLAICQKYQTTLQEQISLCEHTTFRIGGNADYWIEAQNTEILSELIRLCKQENFPCFIMGKGSNILATDEGFHGLIIHMGNGFSDIHEENGQIIFEAGLSLVKASKYAEEHALTGMEGLSGIPGTVGGALYMNAGAYGYEMAQIVTGCIYMDENGNLQTMNAEELQLAYRHSYFMEHRGIIISVSVQLNHGEQSEISAKMREFLTRRNEKQPLNYPSAGSTFKRPKVGYASQLIDECGLKGYTVGGAMVSEKHAGFVINQNHATFSDVIRLCADVQRIVKEQKGISLELEPIILGTYQKE